MISVDKTPFTMKKTIDTVLSAKRKRFLRNQPIYQTSARASEMGLYKVAKKLQCKLTLGLSKWLLEAGYGDIENNLSFREDWFCLLNRSPLPSLVAFAHDDQDNLYAYDPKKDTIYFIAADNSGYARLADDFCTFLNELIKRDYDLPTWRDSFTLEKFDTAETQQAAG